MNLLLSFRLLTEYHSFLFGDVKNITIGELAVSVSLRSIIHSYESTIAIIRLGELIYVSVSLRSIIHSYTF